MIVKTCMLWCIKKIQKVNNLIPVFIFKKFGINGTMRKIMLKKKVGIKNIMIDMDIGDRAKYSLKKKIILKVKVQNLK